MPLRPSPRIASIISRRCIEASHSIVAGVIRHWRMAELEIDNHVDPLTPTAVRLIIKRAARRAVDEHLVKLSGKELDAAIRALSTHSLRAGLTQDLFASGEDAGPIAQALWWTSTSTALRYGRKLAPSSNAAARTLREVRK